MLRWTRTAVLGLLPLAAVLLTAGPAAAHTGLSSTSPAEGAVLTEAPAAVTLTFSGAVRGPEVTVTGPDGVGVGGAATADGSTVTVPVALTASGAHTVTWAVTSADGHRLDGEVGFSFTPPAPVAVTPSAVATPSPSSAAPSAIAPSEAAADSAAADEGTSTATVVGVLVVLLAAGAAAGTLLRRRSRR